MRNRRQSTITKGQRGDYVNKNQNFNGPVSLPSLHIFDSETDKICVEKCSRTIQLPRWPCWTWPPACFGYVTGLHRSLRSNRTDKIRTTWIRSHELVQACRSIRKCAKSNSTCGNSTLGIIPDFVMGKIVVKNIYKCFILGVFLELNNTKKSKTLYSNICYWTMLLKYNPFEQFCYPWGSSS